MGKLFTFLLAVFTWTNVGAQSIYYQPFINSSWPSGWVANDSRIGLLNNVPSAGYFSSPTSPPASGGYNVIFQHCAPAGATITLTVGGVISTVGLSNIRVGFGRRSTGAWDREMALEWSDNGTNWNLISSDVSAGASTTWTSVYYDLPAGTENVTNLRFRFSFVTTTTQNCTAPPNFRIDDFIVGANASLPVELVDFSARLMKDEAQITWTTATETDNAHFAVERSADGRLFTEIGRVTGMGTVLEPRAYTFTDKQPLPGHNYYRLRQVDFNGRFSLSPVRSLWYGANETARIFPMPVVDVLQIQWPDFGHAGTGSWEIFDTAGRFLMRGTADDHYSKTEIPLQTLPSGAYLIRLATERQAWSQVFLKK